MHETQETLQELIREGEELAPLGGNVMGYNGEFQSEYLAWRIQAISALRQAGPELEQFLLEIEKDKRSQYFYSDSVQNILGSLKGALALESRRRVVESVITAVPRPEESNRVFVIHGRDPHTREQVSRFLEEAGLVPLLLDEQSNQGLTIIEKFEKYAGVGFAVALLTPDDVGGLQGEGHESTLGPRARQNVIFELGYFIGRLGRGRVCALTKEPVEIPSDYSGVLYIPLDNSAAWKAALVKELEACGLDVDPISVI